MSNTHPSPRTRVAADLKNTKKKTKKQSWLENNCIHGSRPPFSGSVPELPFVSSLPGSACSPAISVLFFLNSQLIPSHEQGLYRLPTPSPPDLGPAASASTADDDDDDDEGLRLQRPRALGCLSLVMTPDCINRACLFA